MDSCILKSYNKGKSPNDAILLIGIDPGSTVGVAYLWTDEKQLQIKQYNSHAEALINLYTLITYPAYTDQRTKIHFIIEDARLAKTNAYFATKNSSKKDQGVGGVKMMSKDFEKFCLLMGVSYELRPPSNTKVTPEIFERATGIKTLKTHTHCRDAGCLLL